MVEINPFVLKEASTEAFVKAPSQKLPTGVIVGTDSCGMHSYRWQIMFRGKSNKLDHHYVEIALSETLNRKFSCLCAGRESHTSQMCLLGCYQPLVANVFVVSSRCPSWRLTIH